MGNREPKWLTLKEASAASGVSEGRLRGAVERGLLRSFRTGVHGTWIRVTPDSLYSYIRALRDFTRVP